MFQTKLLLRRQAFLHTTNTRFSEHTGSTHSMAQADSLPPTQSRACGVPPKSPSQQDGVSSARTPAGRSQNLRFISKCTVGEQRPDQRTEPSSAKG